MVIDGKEVKKGQNGKELDEHYFQAIKSTAREALLALGFVRILSYKRSKSTDSIYFKFQMNHYEWIFIMSLRTHPPKEYVDNHFYFYLYNYDNLVELKTVIQEQLILFYSNKANKIGVVKNPIDHKQAKRNYCARRKRRRINQQKICSLCFNEDFHRLMNEVNNGNQLDQEMKEVNCTQNHFKRCRFSFKK